MTYAAKSFPGKADQLIEVRRFTQAIVGDAPGVDDVVLLASELAANAIRHSDSGEPDGMFTLHVAVFADRWQVRVDDLGGPTAPEILKPTAEDETGWGLTMVEALASSWGVLGDAYARAVWAEVGRTIPHRAARTEKRSRSR